MPSIDASKIASGTLSAARIPGIDASKVTSGALSVAHGGTGATTAAAARTNLGIDSISSAVSGLSGRFVAGTINKGHVDVSIANNAIWLVMMNDSDNVLVCYVQMYAGVVRRTVLHGKEVTTSGQRWQVMTASAVFGLYSENRICRYACLRLV